MRILLTLALIFCFGCGDDSVSPDAATDAGAPETATEMSVPEEDAIVTVDTQTADVGDVQLADIGAGEAVILDAQSE